MRQVARVRAVRRPREAVVAARQHRDAAPVHLAQAVYRGRQLLRVPGFLNLVDRVSKVGRLVDGGHQPVEPRSVAREHVYPFVVDPRGVVDDVYAVPDAHFDALARASVCAYPDAVSTVCFVDACGCLFVGEVAVARVSIVANCFAGHGELDLVDAQADVVLDDLAHLAGARGIGCDAGHEVAALTRSVSLHKIRQRCFSLWWVRETQNDTRPYSYRNGHFLSIRKVPRPRNPALVDRIPNHTVQPLLGRRGAKTHGIFTVQVALGCMGREQGVLFDTQLVEFSEVTVVPAQVRVGVSESAHQCPPPPVNHGDLHVLFQVINARDSAHVSEAFALSQSAYCSPSKSNSRRMRLTLDVDVS